MAALTLEAEAEVVGVVEGQHPPMGAPLLGVEHHLRGEQEDGKTRHAPHRHALLPCHRRPPLVSSPVMALPPPH